MKDQRDRRDLMQRLNNTSWKAFEDDEQARYFANNPQDPWWAYPLVCGCVMLMIIILAYSIRSCIPIPNKGELDCSRCHSAQLQHKQRMVSYFIRKGSKSPEEMANAVLQTNNPRLLASIAVRETGGNPDNKRTGYKKKHDGAWSVNPAHWGNVPKDAAAQAQQAQRILQELTQERPIKQALNFYGGESNLQTGRYANGVLKELLQVPK
jgi:hypothetical protein